MAVAPHGADGNPWLQGCFDVRVETKLNATYRSNLLQKSDRVLFNNDPVLTPKRERDLQMVYALATTPTPKATTPAGQQRLRVQASSPSSPLLSDLESMQLKDSEQLRQTSPSTSSTPSRGQQHGHVNIGFRRVIHEMFGENTIELESTMAAIGVQPTPKSNKKWGTPLSKKDVDGMTIEDLDGHHKQLQVQVNLEYAVGMSRGAAGGRRAVQQLVEEDKKRAEKKAQRAMWLEHRRRLKQVNMGVPPGSVKSLEGQPGKRSYSSDGESHTSLSKSSRSNNTSSARSQGQSKSREPLTMLGADASKPVYGIRRVPDVDEMISQIRKSNRNGSSNMKPSEVVLRCAKIRQNSAEDLSRLQQGLNEFLRNEMEWEEKRHDLKYVLNSRFDILKKDIDHSVTVGGADYKYNDQFALTDDDRKVLKRLRSSVKARRKRAMRDAQQIRAETLQHMSERRVDLTRQRLGLRAKKYVVTGAQLDAAVANVLKPGSGGNFGAFS